MISFINFVKNLNKDFTNTIWTNTILGGQIWVELLGWSSRCWCSSPTLSSSSWSDNYHHHHCHSSWLLWLSWSCSWWLSPSHHHLIIIRYLLLCRYLQETFDFNHQSLFGKGLCLVFSNQLIWKERAFV